MLAQLSRGLGAVAVVGALTFAVPVASAEAAGGLLGPVGEAIIEVTSAVGGGVGISAAAPEIAATASGVCATGVGCAVLAVGAAAAIGLYLTRDSWMPLLDNGFGAAVGPTNGWSQGKGYRIMVDPSSTSTSMVWRAERERATNYWEEDLFISVVAEGSYACSNGYTGWTRGVVYIPDASGGNSGYYFKDTADSLELPVTQAMGDIGVCGAQGRGTTVGFSGGATAPRVGTAQSWTTLQWGTSVPAATPPATTTHMTVNCTNPDGSAYQVTGPETITGPGVPIPAGGNGVVMPTCVDGSAGSQVGAVGQCYTIASALAGGPLLDQSSSCGASASAAAAAYPNCVGNNFCTYVIRVNGLPCSVGGIGCTDWPARAELTPQNYQCFFGPYQIGLDKCALLERAYEVLPTGTTVPASAANTDGDPRTSSGPAPSTPPPTTARVPAPTTTTTVDPVPCPVGAACTPPPPVPLGDDCFPSGWGAFNPVSWVQQPIQCAMRWTFVPDAATLTEVQTAATNDFTGQGFGPVLTALAVDVGKVGGGSGCDGPAVTFSAVGIVKPMHPFSACAEPMATLASISYAVTTVVVILGGGWALLVAIGAGFGFNVKRGGGVET